MSNSKKEKTYKPPSSKKLSEELDRLKEMFEKEYKKLDKHFIMSHGFIIRRKTK